MQAAAATDKPVILVSEKLGSAGEVVLLLLAALLLSISADTVYKLLHGAGLDLLNQFGVADCSYDLTPQQLCEKIKDVDALIVRSATKVWMFPNIPYENSLIPTAQHVCAHNYL